MKLVELLVKKLDSWPKSVDGYCADPDGEVRAYSSVEHDEELTGEDFYPETDKVDTEDRRATYYSAPPTVIRKAQWQAERDRQKGGEWKRHRAGRNQPVNAGVRVEVKLRCGDVQQGNAHEFIWLHSECDVAANIMQYRIISQPQAEEVEVKDTTIGTLSYKVEIDTAEATQAIDDLAAKWDQIETPFKWRDTVNELDAYIEEFTREREALINRLAEEGFALIPAMTPVMGVADIDFRDWRNWKEGDVIEVIANKGGHEFETGDEVTVINIDEEDSTYRIEATKDGEDWWLAKSDGKFILRP